MPYTPWGKGLTYEDGEVYYFPTGDDYLDWLDVDTHYCMNKRLTDAECAAEYYRLKADLCSFARITDSPLEIDRKAAIMFRFAATPSYDEVDE